MPDHVRSQALIAAQKQSLEMIVTGAPLLAVLHHLVTTVEEQAGDYAVASIMLLDENGCLRNAAAPSLPDHYLQANDGLPANPTLGTCCAAAALGQPVITPDFAAAPGWKGISHLPLGLGLRGAWSMPILARDGSVLGTFGTYFRECREPTTAERAVVEVLAHTAAIAIERAREEAELKARNEELRSAKEEAESASRAKSQFLAVMSHELRTPLAGIIGYADLLASGVGGSLSDTHSAHIARIKAGAWHLVSIIDEILTFSRVEAGKEELSLERVDIAELVRDSAALLQPQASAKGVELRITEADRELPVETDSGKVRQIVLNLLGNAVKFTDRGFVELSLQESGPSVVVKVRDSGPGIAADNLNAIFEPFVQVDQTNTRSKGGTGLGLTVSRRLAQMLGGDVSVEESVPGKGTTFVLEFPAHSSSSELQLTVLPS